MAISENFSKRCFGVVAWTKDGPECAQVRRGGEYVVLVGIDSSFPEFGSMWGQREELKGDVKCGNGCFYAGSQHPV